MADSPLEKLQGAFVNIIGVAPDANFDAMAYGDTVGWDSVAHMALVSEIELAFDVMLETDDVIALSSFGKAKEILGKHGVQFG
jgi:acyl carrier protein